jgi:hypothetical protein
LNEIIKIPSFKEEVSKFIGIPPVSISNTYSINLQEDAPKVYVGPYLEK